MSRFVPIGTPALDFFVFLHLVKVKNDQKSPVVQPACRIPGLKGKFQRRLLYSDVGDSEVLALKNTQVGTVERGRVIMERTFLGKIDEIFTPLVFQVGHFLFRTGLEAFFFGNRGDFLVIFLKDFGEHIFLKGFRGENLICVILGRIESRSRVKNGDF